MSYSEAVEAISYFYEVLTVLYPSNMISYVYSAGHHRAYISRYVFTSLKNKST